jgi:protease IV
MVLDAEAVIDRRRLRRRLTLWRIAAVILALLFIGALALNNQQMSGPGAFLPHIARLSIGGIITDDHKVLDLIDKLGKAEQVKAVIVDINSPGGTTTGGEAMYDAVRRLAEKKPVVAVCGTLATSAAYIVALATDRIFVYGNTITGSVGVIFQWVEVSELLHTLGVKVEESRSGPLKAVPNPFEPTDEKARALTEEMVQEGKVWFLGLVADRRKLDPSGVAGLTDGRIYSGRQALDLKLVDAIGNERAALEWLQKERNVSSSLSIIDWKPEEESSGLFGGLFHSIASGFGVSADTIAVLLGQAAASLKLDGLVSLWHPTLS